VVGPWWRLGLFAVLLGVLEIALRTCAATWSLGHWLAVHVDGIDPELAIAHIDYRPGCGLAVGFGWTGVLLMISGMAYVWRRRIGFMRRWGSARAWLDWHVMTGVIGPAFILLHSAAKLDNWVSLAFWSMVGAMLSGLLGRYLSTELPELASTATVEAAALDRELEQLQRTRPGARVVDGWLAAYRERLAKWRQARARQYGLVGAVRTLLWLLEDDLLRGRRIARLERALRRSVRGKGARAARRQARRTAERRALVERRRVLLPLVAPLFAHWKAVHVPMAILLTLIGGLHIVLALR
jgi:hypothetical protein